MTLQELYREINGDYDQGLRVLRVEKLMDKHIRKMVSNGVVNQVIEAGKEMDPVRMFESAHAMKGVCGNLGLVSLAEMASGIAEEFRPGHSRKMTDEEVSALVERIAVLYEKTAEGIRKYEAG